MERGFHHEDTKDTKKKFFAGGAGNQFLFLFLRVLRVFVVNQFFLETNNVVLSHEQALSNRIIGLAIVVHRQLGPGLLESAYEECLCFELKRNDIPYARQVPLAVVYEQIRLDCGYRMDVVANGEIVIELKSVERLLPIHDAQMMTYLRLSGLKVGLLMNFNSVLLKDGLRRMVL